MKRERERDKKVKLNLLSLLFFPPFCFFVFFVFFVKTPRDCVFCFLLEIGVFFSSSTLS